MHLGTMLPRAALLAVIALGPGVVLGPAVADAQARPTSDGLVDPWGPPPNPIPHASTTLCDPWEHRCDVPRARGSITRVGQARRVVAARARQQTHRVSGAARPEPVAPAGPIHFAFLLDAGDSHVSAERLRADLASRTGHVFERPRHGVTTTAALSLSYAGRGNFWARCEGPRGHVEDELSVGDGRGMGTRLLFALHGFVAARCLPLAAPAAYPTLAAARLTTSDGLVDPFDPATRTLASHDELLDPFERHSGEVRPGGEVLDPWSR